MVERFRLGPSSSPYFRERCPIVDAIAARQSDSSTSPRSGPATNYSCVIRMISPSPGGPYPWFEMYSAPSGPIRSVVAKLSPVTITVRVPSGVTRVTRPLLGDGKHGADVGQVKLSRTYTVPLFSVS